jgi:hypothetical protein
MGRWCYFSTGIEYKFWFGVQSSGDAQFFGGDWQRNWVYDPSEWDEMYLDEDEDLDDDEKNDLTNKLNALKLWANGRDYFNQADIESCPVEGVEEYIDWGHTWEGVSSASVISKLLEVRPDKPDVEEYIRKFPAPKDGTTELLNDINENIDNDADKATKETLARWMLGCLIAHQLLYQEDLDCCYEE